MLQCQGSSARSAAALAQRLRRFAGSVDCHRAARRLLPSLSADQLLAFANGLLPPPARLPAGSAPAPDVTELLQVRCACQQPSLSSGSPRAGGWVVLAQSIPALQTRHGHVTRKLLRCTSADVGIRSACPPLLSTSQARWRCCVQALLFGAMQHSSLDSLLVLHALSVKASAALQRLRSPDADAEEVRVAGAQVCVCLEGNYPVPSNSSSASALQLLIQSLLQACMRPGHCKHTLCCLPSQACLRCKRHSHAVQELSAAVASLQSMHVSCMTSHASSSESTQQMRSHECKRLVMHHFALRLGLSQAGSCSELQGNAQQHGIHLQLTEDRLATPPEHKHKSKQKHKRKRGRSSLSDPEDSTLIDVGTTLKLDVRAGYTSYKGDVASLSEAAVCTCAVFAQHLIQEQTVA